MFVCHGNEIVCEGLKSQSSGSSFIFDTRIALLSYDDVNRSHTSKFFAPARLSRDIKIITMKKFTFAALPDAAAVTAAVAVAVALLI